MLLNSENMAKGDWWFKFDFRKWQTDSSLRRCSLETRGFWIDCIAAMHEAGTDSLSGSIEELARLLGCFPEEAARCVAELKNTKTAHVTLCNDCVTLVSRYIQKERKELELLRLRVQRHREKTTCNGDVTVQSKSKSKSKSKKDNLTVVLEEKEKNNLSVVKKEVAANAANQPTSAPSQPEKTAVAAADKQSQAKKPPKRGTRLPDDFAVTDLMLAWARVNTPNVAITIETEKFRDHWASAVKNAVKLDWIAAWRLWMRNAQDWHPTKGSTAQSRPEPFDEREFKKMLEQQQQEKAL